MEFIVAYDMINHMTHAIVCHMTGEYHPMKQNFMFIVLVIETLCLIVWYSLTKNGRESFAP